MDLVELEEELEKILPADFSIETSKHGELGGEPSAAGTSE